MSSTNATEAHSISVVIPTRDRSAMLRRAIESVLCQTRPPDELVVVDDGSSDDTSKWLPTSYANIRYIGQGPCGVGAARNRGIRESTGSWVAFLDSDDEWMPNKLARQMEALVQNPNHRVCHTDEIWIRRGRRVNPKQKHAKSGGWIFQRCLPLCMISPSSVVIHRGVFDEVGMFDEDLPVCEDYELWLRVCSTYSVLYVDEPLVIKYGGHADQLSKRYWGMDRFRIRALEGILQSSSLTPDERAAALKTLVDKIGVYLTGARKRGKTDEIEDYETKRATYIARLHEPG